YLVRNRYCPLGVVAVAIHDSLSIGIVGGRNRAGSSTTDTHDLAIHSNFAVKRKDLDVTRGIPIPVQNSRLSDPPRLRRITVPPGIFGGSLLEPRIDITRLKREEVAVRLDKKYPPRTLAHHGLDYRVG